MNEELEMLDLDGFDLEEIERSYGRYKFPVASVQTNFIYFNKRFTELIKNYPYVKYYTTPEYVIMEFLSEKKDNSFKVARHATYGYSLIPVNLKEKKLPVGFHKIYKCKKGYAFKRYEMLEKMPA